MNNKVKVGILVVITILVVSISYILSIKDDKESQGYSIVSSYNTFFTVDYCASKYISYLSNKDIDKLTLILNENYKKENKINKDNIFEFIEKLSDKQYLFSSRKMYEEKISDNITKYYVKGYIVEDVLLEDDYIAPRKIEYYLIVYLDSVNQTFSIEPYNGKIFKGDNNG